MGGESLLNGVKDRDAALSDCDSGTLCDAAAINLSAKARRPGGFEAGRAGTENASGLIDESEIGRQSQSKPTEHPMARCELVPENWTGG